MLLLWMGYAVLVGAVVAGAAALLERGIRARRRWLWAGAQLLLVTIPLIRPLLRRLGIGSGGLDVAFGPIVPAVREALPGLDALGRAAAGSLTLAELQGPLVGAWIGATLVLAAVLLTGALRVRRLRRAWAPERVDGVHVLVSESLGPAVVGVLRPTIVLPSWVLAMEETQRALILAHEDEHRRTGDPRLLAASLALPVLMPWNPAAWWAFARLRDAVETDCDARVLARGAGKPLHYARVLVDVGTRATDAVPMGAGFGERAPQLERRVRAMLEGTLGFGWKGLALRLAFAGLLVAAACTLDFDVTTYNVATPDAASARPDLPEAPAAPTVPASGASVRDVIEKGPSFTPFTVAPTILNRDEITHAMDAAYPPLLREAGIGGAVQVYFYIDAEGAVQDTRVSKSSGHQALDQAAIRVAKLFRFSPALNRDKKVAVWVSFPITFQVK